MTISVKPESILNTIHETTKLGDLRKMVSGSKKVSKEGTRRCTPQAIAI